MATKRAVLYLFGSKRKNASNDVILLSCLCNSTGIVSCAQDPCNSLFYSSNDIIGFTFSSETGTIAELIDQGVRVDKEVVDLIFKLVVIVSKPVELMIKYIQGRSDVQLEKKQVKKQKRKQ